MALAEQIQEIPNRIMILIPPVLALFTLVPNSVGGIPFLKVPAVVTFLSCILRRQFLDDQPLGQHESQGRDSGCCALPFNELMGLILCWICCCKLAQVEVFDPADGIFLGQVGNELAIDLAADADQFIIQPFFVAQKVGMVFAPFLQLGLKLRILPVNFQQRGC